MWPYSLVAAAAMSALCAWPWAAAGNTEPAGDCRGVDFDVAHPVAVGKIVAGQPRVYFVKGASDDASCPAAADACREKAYLIPGNLALTGKTFSAYTCVSYESAEARKVQWTNGWLPAASLTAVKPAPAPSRSDWIGTWDHASGTIAIATGGDGDVTVHGEGFYQAAQNVHTGVIDAIAKPANGLLEFADDGSVGFGDPKAGCLVRMQRVEALLVVEDNDSCGGIMVTFTGFYRKK